MTIIILLCTILLIVALIIIFAVNFNSAKYNRTVNDEQQIKFLREYKKRK